MNKLNSLKSKLSVLSIFLGIGILSAQDFRSIINDALSNYLIPIIALAIIIGITVGLIKNWEQVNDPRSRQEGLINVGVIVLYAALVVGVLLGAAALVRNLNINI